MKEKYISVKYGKVFLRIDNETVTEKSLIFLHGFGMDLSTFDNLVKQFTDFKVIRFDFLGFGKSSDPVKPIGIKEYGELLDEVVKRYCGESKIYLLGHSFGGRVCIYYASKNKVEKVFLVNAKALKNKSIKHKIGIIKYKIKKNFLKLFNKNKYIDYIRKNGSRDYKMLNDVMKKSFVKVVNYDLKRKLKRIKNDVIIIGSLFDKEVKYEETLLINKYIKNSKLYPCYNSGHFTYIQEEAKIINIIRREL